MAEVFRKGHVTCHALISGKKHIKSGLVRKSHMIPKILETLQTDSKWLKLKKKTHQPKHIIHTLELVKNRNKYLEHSSLIYFYIHS